MRRKVLIENFWPPINGHQPQLYQCELGWQKVDINDAGVSGTKEVFDELIVHRNFDLGFFFVDNREFYFIDNANAGGVFKIEPLPEWDGKFLFEKCRLCDQQQYDVDYIMMFDDVSEMWDTFMIDGHHLKYVLEHSVLFVRY